MKKFKKNLKCILFAVLLCMVMGLTACQSQMVEVTQHQTGKTFTNKYMDSLGGITSVDYEGYWMSQKVLWMELSGKDQGYRGIIYIDEKEAQRLMEDYDDWWLEQSPLPQMKDVDMTKVQGSDWYCSNEFTKEFNTMLSINDLRFNGVDAIIFDVHTF